jgi:hypothetical protein
MDETIDQAERIDRLRRQVGLFIDKLLAPNPA